MELFTGDGVKGSGNNVGDKESIDEVTCDIFCNGVGLGEGKGYFIGVLDKFKAGAGTLLLLVPKEGPPLVEGPMMFAVLERKLEYNDEGEPEAEDCCLWMGGDIDDIPLTAVDDACPPPSLLLLTNLLLNELFSKLPPPPPTTELPLVVFMWLVT